MSKKKLQSKQIFSIVTAILTLIANILVVVLLVMAMRYAGLENRLFYSVFGIVVCLLVIVDIIFFVGFNHRDHILKIVTCVFAAILVLGGSVGSYYIYRVNSAVDNLVNVQDGETYETIRVTIATYKNTSITDIDDLNGKTVGSLSAAGVSAASVGQDYLTENGVEPTYKTYNMTTDL